MERPTAYHGVMGQFTLPKLGFVNIKYTIAHGGALIDMKANKNTIYYGSGGYGRNITSDGEYMMMLNAGTYNIELFMDGDNEDGSRVTYQKYEIDAIYPSFKF